MNGFEETIEDMYTAKLITKKDYENALKYKIVPSTPLEREDIFKIRKQNKLTKCKLAYILGVCTKKVSKWEKGFSKPKGAELRLLNIIARDGIDNL